MAVGPTSPIWGERMKLDVGAAKISVKEQRPASMGQRDMDHEGSVRSTKQLLLSLPPSCMQFCPINPAYFVVGTYDLRLPSDSQENLSPLDHDGEAEPQRQTRNGSLILFHLDGDDLTLKATQPQASALLDLRFQPKITGMQSKLATVSSTGSLVIFNLDTSHGAELQHLATSRCDDLGEEVLFLQCSWHPSVEKLLAVTTSTGLARLLQLDDEWRIQAWTDLSIQNTLEAWSIIFSGPNRDDEDVGGRSATVYCGGDDSMLRYTSWPMDESCDLRQNHAPFAPIEVKGQHNAGITAILPLAYWVPDGGRVVVTGSYDDHLRVFAIHDLHDTYGAKRVRLLSDVNLGGGVWRLSLIDLKTEAGSADAAAVNIRVLASCMHAGPRIVNIATSDDGVWTCSVVARFLEHKSMNYASDFTLTDDGGLRCISTSFYDRLLCLWSIEPAC